MRLRNGTLMKDLHYCEDFLSQQTAGILRIYADYVARVQSQHGHTELRQEHRPTWFTTLNSIENP